MSEPQQQQQQQGSAGMPTFSDATTWSVQLQLLQADLTSPGLAASSSGFWQAHGLNPGSVDMAACIEVLEHLEPQAVDALGHNVLGGLMPRVAVFTTPNWEYNTVLRAINQGEGFCAGEGGGGYRCGSHLALLFDFASQPTLRCVLATSLGR
jgi:hypothetical protein